MKFIQRKAVTVTTGKHFKAIYIENKNILDSEARKLNFNSGSDTPSRERYDLRLVSFSL